MIVIADTSPINSLLQIRHERLLQQLYRKVILPQTVHHELLAPKAPSVVRLWAQYLPTWVQVQRATSTHSQFSLALDEGESEAIRLAFELHATLLLIDERRATIVARELEFEVTGTLGVLLAGERAGLINALNVYRVLLVKTNFRVSQNGGRAIPPFPPLRIEVDAQIASGHLGGLVYP